VDLVDDACRPAEGETKDVFENHFGNTGKVKDARKHRAGKNADTIAGNAMHRGSQGLPPACGNVAFVQPRQRLAATENVKERTNYAGIRGQQHESPSGNFTRK
jgi:hypothetical protein